MEMQLPTKTLNRPNETICVLPTGIHFSGQLRKLWAAIMLISQHQGRKDEYWAYLDDLCEIAGIPNNRGKGREIIKQNLSNLRKLDIEWRGREGDTEIEKTFGAVTEHGFRSKPGHKLIVTWSLSMKAQERLVNPAGFFTKMCLEILSKMKSGASVVLFELACQYENHSKNDYRFGKRPVEWWVDQLTGKKNSSYLYGDFKRSVLKQAISEVGEHTGINLELIEIKEGKRIAELDFKIVPKQDFSILEVSEESRVIEGEVLASEFENSTFNHKGRMVEIGMSPTVASQLIERYKDSAYLELHLSELESAVKAKDSSVKNPPGMLRKALEEGWEYKRPPVPKIKPLRANTEGAFSDEFKIFLKKSEVEKMEIFESWINSSRSTSTKELYKKSLEKKGFVATVEDVMFRRSFEVYLKCSSSDLI